MGTIVAAIDFSDITNDVLSAVRKLAVRGTDAVYLVHVEAPDPDFVGYEPGPQHVRDNVAKAIHGHLDGCQALCDGLIAEGFEAHSRVIQGITHEKILEEAERLEASFIVMGRHGHGALYHLVMGSVSEAVLKHAKQAVLLVPLGVLHLDR